MKSQPFKLYNQIKEWLKVDLKLSRKGLVLVFVPMSVIIVIMGVLAYLLNEAEYDVWKEASSKLIITKANNLGRKFINIRHLSGSSRQDIADLIQSLKKLTLDNPTQALNIEKLEQLSNEGIILAQSLNPINAEDAAKLDNLLAELNAQLTVIEDEEQFELDKTILKDSTNRTFIRQALYLGLALTVILAILMASYFSKGITARLALIFENSKLLAKGQPLLPPQVGHDEIARLDKVFHTMAEKVVQMARKEKAVIDNALDVIFTIDQNSRFSMINNACLKAWGYKPEELIGEKINKILHNSDQALTMVLINKLIKGGTSRTFETRLMRKDGNLIDVLWSATWSDIENSLFCIAHDITQRKEVERLKRDFFAMISHDLRTPLTSILFSLNIIVKRIENLTSQLSGRAAGETAKELNDELQAAENNCAQLLKLIDSMLTVEKIEAGEIQLSPKMFKLSSLIKKADDCVGAYARQQQVNLNWHFDDIVIAADEERLLQVLVNLLGNAIKFSPAKGQVKLQAAFTEGKLFCQVQDEGAGIPEQYLSTIFDRYKQVKSPINKGKSGTGLGLTICQAIVKAHNGEIGVNSKEGEGSTFWFKIPVTSFNKLPEKQISKQDNLG